MIFRKWIAYSASSLSPLLAMSHQLAAGCCIHCFGCCKSEYGTNWTIYSLTFIFSKYLEPLEMMWNEVVVAEFETLS